jgi:hypothetical protein
MWHDFSAYIVDTPTVNLEWGSLWVGAIEALGSASLFVSINTVPINPLMHFVYISTSLRQLV